MDNFWESSWANVDPKRINEYINKSNTSEDIIIKYLRQYNVKNVCDAGCGCGLYICKLISFCFDVHAFDVSEHAIMITKELLTHVHLEAKLKTASILDTGYKNEQFDGVISKDVIDHMSKVSALKSVTELLRITKHGGIVIFTLDSLDEEYITETHIVNTDGDFEYTDGKWKGMIFHPYTKETVHDIIPKNVLTEIVNENGELTVILNKI